MIGLIAARGWLALPDPCLVRPRNTVLDVAQPIDQHGLAALYWALAFTSSHRSLTGSPQITGQIRRSGNHGVGRIGMRLITLASTIACSLALKVVFTRTIRLKDRLHESPGHEPPGR